METHELTLSCDAFVDEWSVKLAQFMRVLLVITSVLLIKLFTMRTFEIRILIKMHIKNAFSGAEASISRFLH